MKKSKRNNFRKKSIKKRIRKSIYKRKTYKLQKGGYEITSFKNLKQQKIILQNSFQTLNDVFYENSPQVSRETWLNVFNPGTYTKYINFSTWLDNTIVPTMYANQLFYTQFDNFFEKLKNKNFIECDPDVCVDYTFSVPGTGTGLYKYFKIYYVIGFIIAYYYKNLTKFINEKYLNTITGSQFSSYILYFLKDVSAFVVCNTNSPEYHAICKIRHTFDAFIEINEFNVTEDKDVTLLIFEFMQNALFSNYLLSNFFDPALKPPPE